MNFSTSGTGTYNATRLDVKLLLGKKVNDEK